WLLLTDGLERSGAVRRADDLESFFEEDVRERLSDRVIVVHHKHVTAMGHGSLANLAEDLCLPTRPICDVAKFVHRSVTKPATKRSLAIASSCALFATPRHTNSTFQARFGC